MITYYTIKEAAEILGVCESTLRSNITFDSKEAKETGKIFAVRLFGSSRLTRIPEAEIKKGGQK